MKMNNLFLTTILLFTSLLINGQTKPATSDIKMISEYGSQSQELTNILDFQNIAYFRVKFIGQKLKGKYFSIYCKEIWDGEIRKIDTLINSKTNSRVGQIKKDTLLLTALGTRVEDKLKLSFNLPLLVGLNRKYDATISDDYSLQDIGTSMKIKFNESFPAFAYILPYIDGDWKNYCGVAKSGGNVLDWGKKFKIKHYLVFEMKFED